MNWGLEGNGVWFLAQAPGPNTPTQAVVESIGLNDQYIIASTNEWVETWKGSWTVIDDESVSGNSTSLKTASGLDAGGKLRAGIAVGIVIGAVAGVGVGIAMIFRLFRRRKVAKKSRRNSTDERMHWCRAEMDAESKQPEELAYNPVTTWSELDTSRKPAELPA